MTTPLFDEDAQGAPLKELLPTFTADYDPNQLADAETTTSRTESELVPGELTEREYQRERELGYHSDLTLDDQMSQFLAAPWDDEPDADPEYAELEAALRLGKARDRDERIKTHVSQYRLEHPEASPED